jgi:hypothetical protein
MQKNGEKLRFFTRKLKQNRYSTPYIGYEKFTCFIKWRVVRGAHGGEQQGAAVLAAEGKGAA